MKKFIAAILLSIYLLNIGGQLALHQYFVYLSDKFFQEQTSKGLYNVNDLTEVKIPAHMPQIADWPAYENISGQVQFDDVSYKYVKMRITRNAIYLMCVPNYSTTRLSGQNIIMAKQVKDCPVPKKNHVPYGKTTLLAKFDFAFLHFNFSSPFTGITKTIVQPVQRADYYYPDIPEQPPRPSC